MSKKLVAKTLIATLGTALALSISASAFAADHAAGYPNAFHNLKYMDMMDTNGDHEVAKEEFMAFHEKMFDAMDKNKDGKLNKKEWTTINAGG